MFSSVRGGAAGLGAIVAVVVVLVAYLVGVGVLVMAYQDGGGKIAGCQVVCARVVSGHNG